ncbi:NAD(P)/FAD-dependent oxidoreductase [Natronoglycomyces albus]|uniref:NAD(P)/FAD-dependent oxidoreductase n=1 Tax=Natronoglycomyces albus TaxID=2811108 RepID=A0A895XSW8_9ACTN|nr:NAD(P)/FAD-dependent oxidoreductase [Natronoglycomyces albus]QSB05636.1 NAD(P)/FAD-dependent oxidoreductase [Natronoglycomyces albus]
MSTEETYDVAIIGGGAAGLSAAVALARSLRQVLVIDDGQPRNAVSHAAHNVLGREGVDPQELLATGRGEAERFGAQFRNDRAVAARRTEIGFEVDLAGGQSVAARRVLLATGLSDQLPDLPGVRKFWGTTVLHCPYCHGWEVKGQRIGILASGPMSIHQALLFRQLSDDVTLFAHDMPDPGEQAWAELDALGITVVTGEVARLEGDDAVRSVVLASGEDFAADAVVVAPRFIAHTQLYEQLGGTVEQHPQGAFIPTQERGQTEIPGVWAAGNSSDLMAMVSMAASAGVLAGVAINVDLATEEARVAVERKATAVS